MSVLNCFVKLFCKLLDIIAFVYGNLRFPSRKNQLPAVENNVLLMSAVEIAQKIKERKLKAVDVVKAYLKRIEQVNPIINAVIKSREEAIREAEQIDEKLEHDWESVGHLPLLGVPFTAKDTVSVEGMPLCAGLVSRKEEVASEDASVVTNLRRAGAIPIAITNVPELTRCLDASNCAFGRTNNPYDLSLTCGGSSGGEGAILSSAGSIIGVGTDIGGSIRLPAYFCGVFGHKITSGVVSNNGIIPTIEAEIAPMFTAGPMSRYASDLKLMLKAMAGDQIERLPKIDSAVDLSKLRIFYMLESGSPWSSPVPVQNKEAILKVVSHFEQTYKVKCTKVDVKKVSDALSMWTAAMTKETPMSVFMANNQGEVNLFLEVIRKLFGRSSHTIAAIAWAIDQKIYSLFPNQVESKLREIKQLKQELNELLGNDGIFLYPCFPDINVKHDTSILFWRNIGYTTVFNITNLPVTQCPLGLNKNGLPLGVQVAANELNDHITLAVAQEIEKVFGGWIPPFPIKRD
ncbi:fatty-acid amide hydrolase 2-like isoform X2 [Dinothrombium tinctorium]|uniref:Fatty-acid amide hydrolase 2-like isoform X2 n=1 Tax=Dinothrombium tinctorium TaxID=1965070 RepID=A0A3S3NW91_9ACAR|nr:fatty-acid amide hydrolase 2-like isoform X2 [Dinothrombium tinctorium]